MTWLARPPFVRHSPSSAPHTRPGGWLVSPYRRMKQKLNKSEEDVFLRRIGSVTSCFKGRKDRHLYVQPPLAHVLGSPLGIAHPHDVASVGSERGHKTTHLFLLALKGDRYPALCTNRRTLAPSLSLSLSLATHPFPLGVRFLYGKVAVSLPPSPPRPPSPR